MEIYLVVDNVTTLTSQETWHTAYVSRTNSQKTINSPWGFSLPQSLLWWPKLTCKLSILLYVHLSVCPSGLPTLMPGFFLALPLPQRDPNLWLDTQFWDPQSWPYNSSSLSQAGLGWFSYQCRFYLCCYQPTSEKSWNLHWFPSLHCNKTNQKKLEEEMVYLILQDAACYWEKQTKNLKTGTQDQKLKQST